MIEKDMHRPVEMKTHVIHGEMEKRHPFADTCNEEVIEMGEGILRRAGDGIRVGEETNRVDHADRRFPVERVELL